MEDWKDNYKAWVLCLTEKQMRDEYSNLIDIALSSELSSEVRALASMKLKLIGSVKD
jgi:hypothetical protein